MQPPQPPDTMQERGPAAAPRLRWAAFFLVAAVLVAFYAKSVHSIRDKTDGYDFYVAARAVFEGEDPREVMEREIGYLTYPPPAALVFLPLVVAGLGGFAHAWSAVNIAFVLATPFLALSIITGRARGHPWWWYLMPGLVCLRCIENNNGLAQSNLFVGFGCLLGIYFVRWGRPWAAGMAIATVAAIKLTPALLGVYFLWKRRWTVAAATAAGGLLWFALLPGLAYGTSHLVERYETWHEQVDQALIDPEVEFDYQPGQSIKAMLLHLLTKSNARTPSKGEYYVNVVALDRDEVKAVVPFISLAILIALLFVSRNPNAPRSAPGPYLEMALVVVSMLLMSPYVRKAHFASLYPAVALACAAILHGALPETAARRLKWSLIAFAVLVNLTSPGIIGREGRDFFAGIAIFLWPTLLFALALAGCATACRRATSNGGLSGQST